MLFSKNGSVNLSFHSCSSQTNFCKISVNKPTCLPGSSLTHTPTSLPKAGCIDGNRWTSLK